MSAFSSEQVCIMAAERMGLDETAALDLQPLVPSALNALAVETASDPNERHWLLTDPATTTATLTSNAADISTLITAGVLKDFLRFGAIYYNVASGQPLIFESQVGIGRMQGPYDLLFNHCYLQGDTLFTRGPNNTALSGTLRFAVPYTPTLSQLPEQKVDDLVSTIVRLRRTMGKADAPQDE